LRESMRPWRLAVSRTVCQWESIIHFRQFVGVHEGASERSHGRL
jgi:hypothetical protein